MSVMTSERLAEVRANLPDPSADLSRRERDSHALLAHVDHLTAENTRLRAGIAVLIRSNWWTGEVHVDDLRDLLSPGGEP